MLKIEKNRDDFIVDARAHTVSLSGNRVVLTHKVWRVFKKILDAAPEPVSREAIIDEVWFGNFEIGEKGLTHALWLIRSALKDNARSPQYIRTIPRCGYKWVGPMPEIQAGVHPGGLFKLSLSGVAALLACLVLTPFLLVKDTTPPGAQYDGREEVASQSVITASNGTKAFFGGRDLIVQNFEGCRFILRPSSSLQFSQPVFSEDGEQIAFRADKPEGCNWIVFDLVTHNRQTFEACPSMESDGLLLAPV